MSDVTHQTEYDYPYAALIQMPVKDIGGEKIFTQRWLPATGSPKAVVLVTHGLHEHSGRYDEFARDLAAKGFAVVAHDLKGHGQSTGVRGLVMDIRELSSQAVAMVDMIRADSLFAGRPLFLFGHSMGGLITHLAALERSNVIAGVVTTGALVKLSDKIGGCTRWLARRLASLSATLGVEAVNVEKLTHDPAFLTEYKKDKLVIFDKVKAATGVAIMNATDLIQSRMGDITYPTLIMHGGDDWLCDVGGARMLHERIRSADKTLRIYDGMYHVLLAESNKAEVTQAIIDWFAARLPAAAPTATAPAAPESTAPAETAAAASS